MFIITILAVILLALLAIASNYGTDRLCEDCYMKGFDTIQKREIRIEQYATCCYNIALEE